MTAYTVLQAAYAACKRYMNRPGFLGDLTF